VKTSIAVARKIAKKETRNIENGGGYQPGVKEEAALAKYRQQSRTSKS